MGWEGGWAYGLGGWTLWVGWVDLMGWVDGLAAMGWPAPTNSGIRQAGSMESPVATGQPLIRPIQARSGLKWAETTKLGRP